ncbi:MAG: hypothetical protein COB15_01450 [Flavobacteriales bacterium]|nr:MAG: hypothetical protein COB15_01450 [Flavobacteriales bacterium]
MGLFDKLFKKTEQPEDRFKVTINDEFIMVEHPQRKTEKVIWKNITEIRIITTDEGPWMPDVWLALFGKEEGDGCLIPQGAEGWEQVYNIVSEYEGFDFEQFINSMGCAENEQFLVWRKE